MKAGFKKFFSISLSVIFALTLFGSGFYVGSSSMPIFSVDASDAPVDMEPFWRVWNLIDTKYATEDNPISDEEKLWGAIQGLARSTGDPYTVFLPPAEKEDFDLDIYGEFGGVGMEVGVEDGIITIIAPLKDTPAWKAGVKAGDKILRIDDVSTGDLTIDEAVALMRGEKGTDVTLTLYREDAEEPIIVTMTRDTIIIPTIDTERKGDVFIVRLYNFNAQSPSLFRDAMRKFYDSGSHKLVLDLRGNPGGFLDAAIDISSWFLPAGKVVVKESFANESDDQVFRSKGYDIVGKLDAEVVVLVDKGSASASEIVAGALQEHGIAKLVGAQTFGKGSVQELVDVTDNSALKITIARWLTPNGISISEGGLTPDYTVDRGDDLLEDLQEQKALELLR